MIMMPDGGMIGPMTELAAVIAAVDASVSRSLQLWQGQDAVDFSHLWAQGYRPRMELLRASLEELSTKASVNAGEQERESGDLSGTAGLVNLIGRLFAEFGEGGRDASTSVTEFLLGGGLAGIVAGVLAGHSDSGSVGLEAPGIRLNADGSYSVGPSLSAGHGSTPGGYEGHADLTLAQAQGQVSGQIGDVKFNADGSISLGAHADGSVNLGPGGLDAHAGVRAGIDASAGVHQEYGIAQHGVTAEGFYGASAEADAHVGLDGASASAGAFAGARGGITESVDVGGVGGSATAQGWVGVGAEADVHATFEDGRLSIGGHAGAALGVGGSVGGGIVIDTNEVANTITEAADWVGGHLPFGRH